MSFKRRFKRKGIRRLTHPYDNHPDGPRDGNMWITVEEGEPMRIHGLTMTILDDPINRAVPDRDSAGKPVWRYV